MIEINYGLTYYISGRQKLILSFYILNYLADITSHATTRATAEYIHLIISQQKGSLLDVSFNL